MNLAQKKLFLNINDIDTDCRLAQNLWRGEFWKWEWNQPQFTLSILKSLFSHVVHSTCEHAIIRMRVREKFKNSLSRNFQQLFPVHFPVLLSGPLPLAEFQYHLCVISSLVRCCHVSLISFPTKNVCHQFTQFSNLFWRN